MVKYGLMHFIYIYFTRIRSVLYGFRFLSYVKYCFYPRINKILILIIDDFFQLSRTAESKKVSLRKEAFLFVDASTNTFDVSNDI